MPCFHLSLIITILAQLDTTTSINLSSFAPSHSHDYLNQICLSNSIYLCKVFRKTIYFTLGDLIPQCTESIPDFWPEWANATVLANKSANSATLMGMVCALTGFIFVCGGYYFPGAYKYPHGWRITGQCLLGYLTEPLTIHKWTEIHHW